MLIPASIIYPVGNLIGSLISYGGLRESLQWIRVSSRSNTIVLRSELLDVYLIDPFFVIVSI